jgi:vitamin B12 transporter
VSHLRIPVVPICFVVCAVGLSSSAAAQGTPTFALTVTEPLELIESVGTTRRIGRAEIEARNARSLDEALRLIPGIYIRTGGDGTPRVDIRGFRSRHVLLLVNGVPVNSTADGQFDPARVSTQAIREIKVSYGSSSVLYGDNAMAAVIEITTVDDRPDTSLDLSVGTPEQWGAGGRLSRTVGKWAMTGAATSYSTDGFRLPGSFVATGTEDGGRRESAARNRSDFRGSVAYRFTPSSSLATEWAVGTGKYGLPIGTVNDANDIFAQSIRYERVEDYRAVSGQISAVVAPWRRFNLRGWVYRNAQREDRSRYDDATYSSMDDPLVQGTFQSRERTTVTGSTALGRLDLQRFGWVRVAVNQRREAFDTNGVIRDVSASGGGGGGGGGGRGGGARPPATFDVRAFALDRHVDVYSTGTEWQVRPAARLGAVVGSAVTWQRRVHGTTEAEPTWIAGLSYDATEGVRFRASATRKVRVPSIDQLYSATAGNPILRTERSYGVDAGVDANVGRASSIGVSTFVTQAKDFIERVSSQPFENRGTYRFTGAELAARTAAIATVDLRGSYTFMDSADVTAGAPNPRLQTRPRHRTTIEWIWTPVGASSVRGAVQHVGRQLFDSRGAEPVQMTVAGYTLVDVGFTQRLTRRYDLAFDVTNLFDELYEQSYGLPREGRAAVLTLRARVN